MKTCTSCITEKPLSDFRADLRYKGGHIHQCKVCRRAARDAWRVNNRERYLKSERTWQRQDYQKNPLKYRNQQLKTHYGITLEQYNRMLEEQGGTCYICKCPPDPQSRFKALAVDHDNQTGQVGKLLCNNHNTGIGLFDHDPAMLRAAADYLEIIRGK